MMAAMKRRKFLITVGGSMGVLTGCMETSGSTTSSSTTEMIDKTTTSPTETTREEPSDQQSVDDALVVESKRAVEGTMVNVGVAGVAKNTATRWLANGVIEVTGTVGGEMFTAQARCTPLPPAYEWEWQIRFGSEADALDENTVEDISIETRAEESEYAD